MVQDKIKYQRKPLIHKGKWYSIAQDRKQKWQFESCTAHHLKTLESQWFRGFSLPFPGRKETLRLRYFAVFGGIFGQFWGFLLQKCCKFFRPSIRCATRVCGIFAYITCCKFLKPTPSEMLHALSRWSVFPSFTSALLLMWIIFSRKSISFQRSAIISPRRIPVFRAIIAKVFALLFFILNFQFNEQEMMNT